MAIVRVMGGGGVDCAFSNVDLEIIVTFNVLLGVQEVAFTS
jgi:hypothetical protein